MSEKLTAIQQVKLELLSSFSASIKQAQPFVRRSMEVAYERGMNDALNWVKEFNETAKKTPELILTK